MLFYFNSSTPYACLDWEPWPPLLLPSFLCLQLLLNLTEQQLVFHALISFNQNSPSNSPDWGFLVQKKRGQKRCPLL
uniref:Uncharacterized protein n=1 Tax=Helianthus annuus TaxID=4232 RepID=A0A251S2S7_HELAN